LPTLRYQNTLSLPMARQNCVLRTTGINTAVPPRRSPRPSLRHHGTGWLGKDYRTRRVLDPVGLIVTAPFLSFLSFLSFLLKNMAFSLLLFGLRLKMALSPRSLMLLVDHLLSVMHYDPGAMVPFECLREIIRPAFLRHSVPPRHCYYSKGVDQD
jgi:hypothetical protein